MTQHYHYALAVQYAGGDFSGWQRQPHVETVQGVLENALSSIANEAISLSVAGRTDAGVHATAQIAGFTSSVAPDQRNWRRALNALTADSIRVTWVCQVAADFHPRYSATSRRYTYVFYDHQQHDPFVHHLAWCCEPLDADHMHRQAQQLLGEHDFSSFRGAGCQSLSPNRRVDQVWVYRRRGFVVMEIEANAFLLHMVRNIASALRDVGRGANPHDVSVLLEQRNRAAVGATAPPQGLYLSRVRYPDIELPPVSEAPAILRG